MKQKSKKINIIGGVILIALVFLCTFNVTYAYFTSVANIEGNLNFGSLDVRFAYYSNGTTTTLANGETTMNILPSFDASISRGSTFNFQTASGDAITYLGFQSNSSCTSYIALKVNAYIMNSDAIDSSTNYGEYFLLNSSNNRIVLGSGSGSQRADVYYFRSALTANGFVDFANSMTLSENAPVELLNSTVHITITFKAVQQPNSAYLYEFGSEWGYLESWS